MQRRDEPLPDIININKLALPKSDNLNPAFSHIGILRQIQRHPFLLSVVKGIKLRLVAVPIVAVKLNDGFAVREKRIDREFPVDNVLGDKRYTYFGEETIPQRLKLIRVHHHLIGVHGNKSSESFWGFVGAFVRAISAELVGWGNLKLVMADLTRQFNLIPAPKKVGALTATRFSVRQAFGCIEVRPALDTRFCLPGFLPACFPVCMVTGSLAILDAFATTLRRKLAAANADVCPDGIFHGNNVPLSTAIRKPEAFYRREEQTKQEQLFVEQTQAIQQEVLGL